MTLQGCTYWVKMSIVGVSNPNKRFTSKHEGIRDSGSPNIYPGSEKSEPGSPIFSRNFCPLRSCVTRATATVISDYWDDEMHT